jgi:DNA-directed RNA polymerase subunit N (RpoN/RPB10)
VYKNEKLNKIQNKLVKMLPVRCFTCGKIIAHLEEKYIEEVESGMSKKDVLDSMNMDRYCCRRMFLAHVDVIEQLLLFPDTHKSLPTKKSDEVLGE